MKLNSTYAAALALSMTLASGSVFADGTVTVSGPTQTTPIIQNIPIVAGSSVIVETVGNGLVQYSCSLPAQGGPVATPAQHWICNESVSATDGNGGTFSIPAQGEGGSKFDAYNALIANCNQQVTQYNSGQPYMENQIQSSGCGSITPNDAGLKCSSM
jgi:hypothetical protein